MSGKIVGAVVVAVDGGHCLLQELHSTKGWRPLYWIVTKHRFPWEPVIGAFHRIKTTAALAQNSGRLERNRRPVEGTPVDLMRHGWYRRKMMAPEPAVTSHHQGAPNE